MAIPLIHVDAFTDTPFAGNPAAVCILPEPRDERWMGRVAQEMNLSATAFVCRQADGFDLRWFTPTVELDLCGHGTLAGAHALWESEYVARDAPISFHTRSGRLAARRADGWIEIEAPATPEEPATPPVDLARALGVTPRYVGRSHLYYLVEVDTEEAVRAIQPDPAVLRTWPVRGVIVTSRASSGGYDFVSRFFAPALGIDEDSVTGSAHCCLGPFWSARLRKTDLLAYQASPRGGVVRMRVGPPHVYLSGQAVTVLRGELVAAGEGK